MSDLTAAKLREMRDAVDDQVNAMSNSIAQVEDQVAELASEADAMETEVMDVAKQGAIDLLETTILADKAGDYIEYGSTFGTIDWSPKGNITDWEVIQLVEQSSSTSSSAAPVPVVVYTYTQGDYPDLDQWVSDYSFCNDYLTRPLYASGLGSEASYGIYPTIANLGTGKEYLENNKDKIEDSQAVFTRYIS